MLRILIAEDEVFVRKSLKNVIESTNRDYKVVAEAGNGKQALELFEKNEIDLILTDIAMPVMDGMEFIMKVREKDTNVKIIVLSCLNDFEYARKALKNHVYDYFLKAETDPAELIVKIDEIEYQVNSERSVITEKCSINGILSQNLYEIQGKFLKMLLWGPIMSVREIEQKVEELNLPLHRQNVFVSYMELDNLISLKEKLSIEELELLDFSILNIAREILEKDNAGSIFPKGNGHYIIIVSFGGENSQAKIREKLYSIFSFLLEQFRKIFSMTLTAGLSNGHNSLRELSTAYNQSVIAFKHRFFLGKGRLLFYNDVFNIHYNNNQLITLDRGFIYASLHNENLPQLKKESVKILDSMISEEFSEKSIRGVAMDILLSITGRISELRGSSNGISMSSLDISNSINAIDSARELKDWVLLSIEAIYNYYINIKNNIPSTNIVDRVKEYLEKNYAKSINLNVVANHFDMNACYISLIFKEKTGENFIDFLSGIRIEKAKSLLKDGDLSVQETGELVGYPNPQYFSKVFKKATGVSPNEYKSFGNSC